jgi:sugar transferase (PEP-CTERM/EpsH1 system associated)
MRIFVLLSRIPWPLEKGDKLRAFHQVKQLSVHNEIILCALNTDLKADKQQAFRALQPYCRSITFIDLPPWVMLYNLVRAFFLGKPLQVGYFYGKNAHKRIEKLISQHQPALLYGQLIRVADYLRNSSIPKAIDYQDVLSKGMQRRAEIAAWFMKPFYTMEYKRLLRFEKQIFDDFDIKTIISKPDRDLIPHPLNSNIYIVPNGVDHDFFSPQDAEKQHDVVFTGNMAYPPNVNAAEFLVKEIMPIVWDKLPNARVMIAGATPDPRVKALSDSRVFVSGWLDDIRQAYSSSRVFIAPMQIGTGLQNKLLEAMAMGLACITTPLANSALNAVDGKEILIGADAYSLSDQIVALLSSQEQYKAVAEAGHEFVKSHYNWNSATGILEKAMSDLLMQKQINTAKVDLTD